MLTQAETLDARFALIGKYELHSWDKILCQALMMHHPSAAGYIDRQKSWDFRRHGYAQSMLNAMSISWLWLNVYNCPGKRTNGWIETVFKDDREHHVGWPNVMHRDVNEKIELPAGCLMIGKDAQPGF